MGGGDEVVVNKDEVLATAQWIANSAAEFNAEVQGLMTRVRSVIGGTWQGNASTTFDEPWREWYSKVNNLIGALEDDAYLLRSAVDDYANTDSATGHALEQTFPVNI
jgi:WXG100 family type VII secretion target